MSGAIVISFFRAGKLVTKSRVRDFLGLGISHVAMRGEGWACMWGSNAFSGVTEEALAAAKKDIMRRGKSAKVWGELYEARDLEEVAIVCPDAGAAERFAREQVDYGERRGEMRELEMLAGSASACAAKKVLSAGGCLMGAQGRSERSYACADLYAEVMRATRMQW